MQQAVDGAYVELAQTAQDALHPTGGISGGNGVRDLPGGVQLQGTLLEGAENALLHLRRSLVGEGHGQDFRPVVGVVLPLLAAGPGR